MKSSTRIILFVAVIALLAGCFYFLNNPLYGAEDVYNYNQFQTDIRDQKVQEVTIKQNRQVPTGKIEVTYESGVEALYVSDVNEVQKFLTEQEFYNYTVKDVMAEKLTWESILYIVIAALFLMMFFTMFAGSGHGNSQMNNFGKSRARLADPTMQKITFQDVAGMKEEKEQLEEVVDFLADPQKYNLLGARIPKGVIMMGPPGTGKTLLAKAVAGEAGVPYFSISGSDFVEMFVGVGASRVRDLFENAKKNTPCIIFIDEIDAVARKRGSGLGGGHDEKEQTLNQLLVEMDGFSVNEGIIVMAATNRIDILDPAILRPGRFDRHIAISRPDVQAREDILKVHSREKPLSEDVDLGHIARVTAGFTGADLENLMNESAIEAAKDQKNFIMEEHVKKAFIKVGIGTERTSAVITDRDKEITAYHEAGHAVLFHVLPDEGPVYTVSVIPTGMGAAGYTMPLPEKDHMHVTKGKMFQDITVAMGGRVAESIAFEDVTAGAVQDIKQATEIARNMVMKYGFSEKLGMIDYSTSEDEVFIGREIGQKKAYSEKTTELIDQEVSQIIENARDMAFNLLKDKWEIVERVAKLLIEKERINREEFESCFDNA